MTTRYTVLSVAAVAALLASGAGSAFAQGGFGGGGGGFGGGAPPSPAVMAKMQEYRKFGESHPNYRTLSRTIRAVGEMDKDPATKITKDEAKKMLVVIKPWMAKPVMKDDDAKAVNNQLAKLLSLPQIKKMAALASQQGGRGGGRPGGGGGQGGPGGGGGFGGGAGGGGGRPGGAGGPGGGGGRGDMSKMPSPKEYNPLNVNSYPNSPMSQRGKQRITDFLTMLKQRAA